jgi:protein-serine/threonine kinase
MADGRRPSMPRSSISSNNVRPNHSGQPSTGAKPADYVYFQRSTANFSDEAVPRAKTAQLRLEHFYKIAVEGAVDRNTRWISFENYVRDCCGLILALVPPRRVELERRLQGDTLMSEERKQRQLLQLGKKESTFLRLRRTKLGLNDFRTVKVIGKGAFGEVSAKAFTVEFLT